jgi:restriction system protein
MKKYLKKKIKNDVLSIPFLMAAVIALVVYNYSHKIDYAIFLFSIETVVIVGIYVGILMIKKRVLINSPIYTIDRLSGEQFEEYVLAMFERQGYKGYLTRTTADFGADIVIEKNGIKTVVQVKRWNSKISIDAVQQIIGAIRHYSASRGMVVTNSYFTANARELATSNGIVLWDRNYIIHNWSIGGHDAAIASPAATDVAVNISPAEIDSHLCPKCGAPLVQRNGKCGPFLGCGRYPDCHYTRNMDKINVLQ